MRMGSIVLVVLALVTGATGCTRSVCGFENGGLEPTLQGRWASSQELIPPSATVCGHWTGNGSPSEDSVTFDFESDDNPFVTITRHLEGQGWARTDQETADPERQTATFQKVGQTLLMTTTRESGRVWAELQFP